QKFPDYMIQYLKNYSKSQKMFKYMNSENSQSEKIDSINIDSNNLVNEFDEEFLDYERSNSVAESSNKRRKIN
ncbi:30413_t:CDS:1, partial [Racocetra persica]